METVPPERMPGERALEGAAQYHAALDELLAHAEHEVRIFEWRLDRHYNTPQRCELLSKLLLAARRNRVSLILHDASNVERDCPRLMTVLRRFSESLSIRKVLPPARHAADPFAVADEHRFVHRFHHEGMRGVASIADIERTQLMIRRFEELREASAPGVTATHIGL